MSLVFGDLVEQLQLRGYSIHSALPVLDLAMARLIVAVVLVALAMTKMPALFSHPNSKGFECGYENSGRAD